MGFLAEWVATLGRCAAASLVDMFRDHHFAEPTQHFCSSCYRTLGSGQVVGLEALMIEKETHSRVEH